MNVAEWVVKALFRATDGLRALDRALARSRPTQRDREAFGEWVAKPW